MSPKRVSLSRPLLFQRWSGLVIMACTLSPRDKKAMTAIFISHRSSDNVDATELKQWLADQGHKHFFLDFDPADGIPAGVDWEQTIYHNLRQCQALLIVLTPDWLASKWCFAELAVAREQGKAVFVVRTKPVQGGPVIPALQEVNLTEGRGAGLAKLARGLRECGLDPRDAFDWYPERPIYPGLNAFEEEDAAIFFGRSEESWRAVESLERLRRQGRGAPRLVLITGASGSGKSSLMRAGIIPRLKKYPGQCESHSTRVNAVAVTSDGRRAVSGSTDGTLRIWDLESGQTLRTLEGYGNSVVAVAITSDGRRDLSGSDDGTLRLWNLENGQILCTLEGHTGGVIAVAVTCDRLRAVSAATDGTLRLWDLETGQTLRALKGHGAWVNAIAVTPDGRRAVSVSNDLTLRLWDLESGQSVCTLQGHMRAVLAVAITPDGCRAVSAAADKTLRLWDLKIGQKPHTI
jgi:hypothetical protein